MWMYIAIGIVLVLIIAAVLSASKPPQKPARVRETFFDGEPQPTSDVLLAAYRAKGLDNVAAAVEAKALPCFLLRPMSEGEVAAAPATKMGGVPSLPSADLWPKYKDKSLAFIAQIDLSQLPRSGPNGMGDLLAQGMLYFFYDAEQSVWGFDPKDKDGWRVLYVSALPSPMPQLDYPSDLPDHARYPEVRLQSVADRSLPDPNSLAEELGLSAATCETVIDMHSEYIEKSGPRHQLLGYPAVIQGEMELECQLASNGLYCGDASGYKDPRAESLKAGAVDWRLLLQVDSDDAAGMMWGDCGRIYCWIREQDLKAGCFDKVWMVLQCY